VFYKTNQFYFAKNLFETTKFQTLSLYQKFLCLKTKAKSLFYFHHIQPLIGELPATTAYTLTSSSVNLFDSKVTPPSKTLTV
jgi:hypothetical protein